MFLNPSKCKFMLISRKHNRMNNHPAITINGQTLETVSTFKYLGLLLSYDLSWTKHIEEYMYAPKQRKFWACYTVNFTSTLTKETLLQLYPLSGPTRSTQYQSGTNTWKKIRIYWKELRSLHAKWILKTGIKATMSFCIWQTYPLLQTEGCTLNCVLCTKLCTICHTKYSCT